MNVKKYKVEVQSDFIEHQAKANPVQAVAELVWNGLDADAQNVNVRLEVGERGAATVVVRDDGTGMPFDDAPELFARLGGSWKQTQRLTPDRGRIVHGREGNGRLKVFGIGRCAEWAVRYRSKSGELREYNITMLKDSIEKVRITGEEPSGSDHTGAEARISELFEQYDVLESHNMVTELNELFALYLNNYRDVSITYNGIPIAPKSLVDATHTASLEPILINGRRHQVTLEIVEWNCKSKNALYLCSQQGFPLMEVPTSIRIGNYNFSAYLKSAHIENLDRSQRLELAEMDPALNDCIKGSRRVIKSYFRSRSASAARSLVNRWKDEEIYPFKGDPMNYLEDAERKVFDIVAVTTSDFIPDFQSGSQATKAFQLRMLRTVLEKNSDELELILNEALGLPQGKQKELAGLLRETSLSSMISAVKIVANRMKFLASLEEVLFGSETKKRLKERSQLHKILEDNIWMFGEEYMLSASDSSLTNVLRKHQNLLGDTTVIDRPVEHYSTNGGVVDLMLSRTLGRHGAGDLQHLVIELIRPRVTVGKDQVTQILDYAFAVMRDERLISGNQGWEFWVVSDDLDEFTNSVILENEQAQGTILRKRNCVIRVKRWAQVLEDNRTRLQFFQEKFEYSARLKSSVEHIQSRHNEFMNGLESGSERPDVSIQ